MILFDTETTGFINAIDAPLKNQPKIIELFALKLNDQTLAVEDELELLIDPKQTLTAEIVGITGITDDMVRGQGEFPIHLPEISEFWLGQRWMAAHNLTYDADMLELELRRCGAVNRFPWPPKRLCTVEASEHLKGRRLKLIDLHTLLFGVGFEKAHRARNDVEATHRCMVELKALGDIPNL